ncbi:4-hydroxyphenylacetate catabolism regulatory protein HpaA [Pseudomonas sp. KSR10]|jgi:AraC family 4-hydroxyphenylacetate 3-monooxygenase operon regulatory protein|uniref:AraC family transcriptional regulator n=1 Tax=Stutzerimonas stutzeri TaxID=316 RepID=A0A0D9AHF6_STUST|nr:MULTISPECIES: 4-hydroxyphenylacetate catabolism regulatory protein HpaA [Pseudomonadaceae]KJH80480.1 AraC family transcriptional regulator [Stutzerimonas stutzeri]MCG6541976.1 4-hydroxyphenylacetate catabolism regulatory protein HpaA [Pseudomonas sp. KSR10]
MRDQQPIPNIDIGQVYDQRYADAEVHYEALGNLADFFGRNMPVHRHDRFFQVHYVKSGTVRVYLDDQRYQQQGPMFFLTPPTFTHAFVTDAESDGHVITVRQQLIWPLLSEEFGLASGPNISPVCVGLAELGPEFGREIMRLNLLFDELRSEFAEQRPGRALSLISLTRLIFISLLRLSSRSLTAQPARGEDLHIYQRFNELIEAHYQAHWSLSQYAEALGATEARLNDVCRRIADLPSKRLVHDRLMQEAKRLLLFTGHSVNEICYELGFKDPAYFSRFFSRNADVTPGEYRLRAARNDPHAG